MNFQQLMGEFARSIAAGFFEHVADTLKKESKQLGENPEGRNFGRQLAEEMVGTHHPTITIEPIPESELIEKRLAVWNYQSGEDQ